MKQTLYFIVTNGKLNTYMTDDESVIEEQRKKGENIFFNRLQAIDFANIQITEMNSSNKVKHFNNTPLEQIRENIKAQQIYAEEHMTDEDKHIREINKANEIPIEEQQRQFALSQMTEDDYRIIREMKRERYKNKNKLRFNEKEQKSFHEFMERQAKRVVER